MVLGPGNKAVASQSRSKSVCLGTSLYESLFRCDLFSSGALICFVGSEIGKKCVHTLLGKLKSLLYSYTFVRGSCMVEVQYPTCHVSD